MSGDCSARVLVGLSGGVDSAVAAMRLQELGFEVIGVRMSVYDGPEDESLPPGCYGRGGAEDTASAERLARSLGIPFQVLDCAAAWRKLVLDYFRAEYLAGRTPNPCIRCNETVKFDLLPRLAREAGLNFDFFATGHYARKEYRMDWGGWVLKRGRDRQKDQSYFLYRLPRERLERIIFPLGDMSKDEVRRLAAERGLAVHDRPDSQDFYGGRYVDLLNAAEREGEVVDREGRMLGRHRGFWHFTPGQRKGLGVCAPQPLYVLGVDAQSNQVLVGPREENFSGGCLIGETRFFRPVPEPGARLLARLRSSQPLEEVIVGETDGDGRLQVAFARPLASVAPGQSLVLYDEELVVGGGIIQPTL